MRKSPQFWDDTRPLYLGYNWKEENKEDYLYHYRRHVEEVKRIVPEDKLLIFDVREGYVPLCNFLGVPVKEGSLPRLNDGSTFRRRLLIMNVVTWGVVIGLPIVLCGFVWIISRYL